MYLLQEFLSIWIFWNVKWRPLQICHLSFERREPIFHPGPAVFQLPNFLRQRRIFSLQIFDSGQKLLVFQLFQIFLIINIVLKEKVLNTKAIILLFISRYLLPSLAPSQMWRRQMVQIALLLRQSHKFHSRNFRHSNRRPILPSSSVQTVDQNLLLQSPKL